MQFLGSADSGLGLPSIGKWAKGQKAKWNIIYAAAILIGINLVMGVMFLFRTKSGGPLEGVQVMAWKLEIRPRNLRLRSAHPLAWVSNAGCQEGNPMLAVQSHPHLYLEVC